MTGNPALTNQWNDFLLRKTDPYAQAKYEILLSWLGDLRGKTALVVGAGSGEFAALLAKAGAQVTATDIDEASIQLTRKTADAFGVSLQTSVATLQSIPLGTQYSLVVATDVVEHISDDRDAALRISKLTHESGRIVITVPALPSLFGYHDEVLGHFRRYTTDSLGTLFKPFAEIERIRYYGFFLVPVALLISKWLRRPYPVAEVGEVQGSRSILGKTVRTAFSWEKAISPPLGTSVLMLAKPRRIGAP